MGSTNSTVPTTSAVHLTAQSSLISSRKLFANPNLLKSSSNVSWSFRKWPRGQFIIYPRKMAVAHLSKSESSPSKFVKSRPRSLSLSNSTPVSVHSAVTCCATLGALLAMTVVFLATTVLLHLPMVPSPTIISASLAMTSVDNTSTSKDPTGTQSRHPLSSVLPTVRLKVRRLNPVRDIVFWCDKKIYSWKNTFKLLW